MLFYTDGQFSRWVSGKRQFFLQLVSFLVCLLSFLASKSDQLTISILARRCTFHLFERRRPDTFPADDRTRPARWVGILHVVLQVSSSYQGTSNPRLVPSIAFAYHSVFSFQALLHAIMGIGIIGLVGKIHKWDESAIFFDGSSLGRSLFISLTVPVLIGRVQLHTFSLSPYTSQSISPHLGQLSTLLLMLIHWKISLKL